MERLTKKVNGYIYGAEGVSLSDLTGLYCRGEYEATAITERLYQFENLVDELHRKLKKCNDLNNDGEPDCINEFLQQLTDMKYIDADGQYNIEMYFHK